VRQSLSSRGALVAATLTGALLLAACGSSGGGSSSTSASASASASSSTSMSESASSSGSSGLDTAMAAVMAAEQAPTWQGPDATVDVAPSKGKSVYYISFADAIPVLKFWSTTVGQLLEKQGMKYTLFDSKGQVAEAKRGFEQAIAAKPDVIITQALPVDLFKDLIAKAKAENIKVITGNTGTPGVVTAGQTAEVTFDYPKVGQILANWFIADSAGKGNGLLISSNDVPASPAQANASEATVAANCPDCKLDVKDVQIASWQTELPTLTRSSVNANPDLGYILPMYDGQGLPVLGALRQAQNTTVKVGAFNATPSILPQLADKTSNLAADLGGANEWWSYACADAVFRALAGTAPVENYNIGLRLFTRENIKDIDLKADEASWYGQATYQEKFKALWQNAS